MLCRKSESVVRQIAIMHQLNFGFKTHVGNVRSHNEDCLRTVPESGLWVVADGMGGHEGGETASAIAVEVIVKQVCGGISLQESILNAHHAIKQASREGKGPEGMGTTVVALSAIEDRYEIAWVGDCRAYLWDGGHLQLLTRDHSYVQHLVDTGVISAGESDRHPYQDILLQALGAKDIPDVTVDRLTKDWHRSEQVLLCSDGLTKELDHQGISDILALDIDEQAKVERLINTALEHGGKDNITAVLISAKDTAPAKSQADDTVPIDTRPLQPGGFISRLRAFFKCIGYRSRMQ